MSGPGPALEGVAFDGRAFDAVVFDLLTALIDSWTLWNRVAGSAERGLAWRRKYLELTYQAGAYRPYETVVRDAARLSGVDPRCADELIRRWGELAPWPETPEVLAELGRRCRWLSRPIARPGLAGWRPIASACRSRSWPRPRARASTSPGPSPIAPCSQPLARRPSTPCSSRARRRMCPVPRASACRSIGTIALAFRHATMPDPTISNRP